MTRAASLTLQLMKRGGRRMGEGGGGGGKETGASNPAVVYEVRKEGMNESDGGKEGGRLENGQNCARSLAGWHTCSSTRKESE